MSTEQEIQPTIKQEPDDEISSYMDTGNDKVKDDQAMTNESHPRDWKDEKVLTLDIYITIHFDTFPIFFRIESKAKLSYLP